MWMIVRLLVLALLIPLPCVKAQTNHYNWNLHGEANIGSCVHGYRYIGGGGGGEVFLWKRLTAGGRVLAGAFSDSEPFAIVQGEIGYHAVNRQESGNTDPFVTGGFGLASDPWSGRRSRAAASFGGGANFWLKPSVALRIEGRIIAFRSDAVIVAQIGVAFR